MSVADLTPMYSGKVRDIYDAGDGRLLMVTSDRLSAFDVVMAEPIPDKGRVLTAMSAFWFEQLDDVVGSHLISTDLPICPTARRSPSWAAGSMLCRRAEMLPIECIVRGYITGSAWKEYRADGHHARRATARRAAGVVAAARAGVHPVDQGRGRRPRREHLVRAGRRPRRARARRAGARRLARALHAGAQRGPPSGGSSSPTPSSSSAWSTASWSSPTRSSRRTPRASGRPTSGSRARRRRRSTSSRCATTSTRSTGTRSRRRRRCPPRSSTPPATATSRPTSASPAARSPTGPGEQSTSAGVVPASAPLIEAGCDVDRGR